jgi:hypothetical protein
MKTVMIQAGYELKSGKIIENSITKAITISELRRSFEITNDFMSKYGLSNNSKLFINFDIEVNVKYLK